MDFLDKQLFDDATEKLERVRAKRPEDPEVLHCIGLVLVRQRQFGHAIDAWLGALMHDEMYKPSWLQLIYGYRETGRFDEGEKACAEACRLFPNDENVLMASAELIARTGNIQGAVTLLREAADLAPDNPVLNCRLGTLLLQCREWADALMHSRKALEIAGPQPIIVHAHAEALQHNSRFGELVRFMREHVEQFPDDASFYQQLANALEKSGDSIEAVNVALEAHRKFPDHKPILSLLCHLLRITGQREEHERLVMAQFKAQPESPFSQVLMANLCHDAGRLDEAENHYRRALALGPDLSDARTGLGMVLLARGRWDEGWTHYDARIHNQTNAISVIPPFELWDGREDANLKLLVVDEQGLGDTIQFSRFLPLARKRVGELHVLADKKLSRLLAQVDPAFAAPADELDVPAMESGTWRWIPIMSLAHVLGVDEPAFAAAAPYLEAEPDRIERWSKEIGAGGLRIGIAWQGNPTSPVEAGRSLPLSALEPLVALDGVTLFSLQKHHGLEQLDDVGFGDRITTFGDDFDAGSDAFIDTAAVMANLDLVITSDTSIAHLAGALGCPTWVALSDNPEWRWLRERSDSPWYPTMRLFRQETSGDWAGVFEHMTAVARDEFADRLKAGRDRVN